MADAAGLSEDEIGQLHLELEPQLARLEAAAWAASGTQLTSPRTCGRG
jgi:hypothetical protein